MQSPVKTLTGAAAAFALCASPTIAAAAPTTAVQSVRPLVAVSVFGTQASAQIVCSQGVSSAVVAGAAAAQGQAGCVLPAADIPPVASAGPGLPPPTRGEGLGVGWILAGLDALLVIAGISTLFDDDDDDDDDAGVSPA